VSRGGVCAAQLVKRQDQIRATGGSRPMARGALAGFTFEFERVNPTV
jgi:hypothetical protein